MNVYVTPNADWSCKEYTTELTDIQVVADIYGDADDTVALYDNNDELVAVAYWPMGYKHYQYKDYKRV